ncbi:choline transporter [Fusarium pseudoanthophilum]|uniref:Choline transporter n=1 Tax=Fusarium pseudoanthophilum TaxID=48495 RepID=A0A8H5L1G2_9HYPO|nr:choline transporter [Fusarium pseudoanthophilum]
MEDTETASISNISPHPPKLVDGATQDLSPDELLLRAQGHHGELPRQFSSFAALSLAFVITNSWLGYCASFAVPLLAGGGPGVFWGVIVAAVACLIITAGLAELASAYPSSGGQYHFAFMVSSVKSRAIAAFITGWLSTLAWCLTTTSAAIYCAEIALALASLFHPSYVPTQWQTYLIYLLVLILAGLLVCFASRILPSLEKFFFWCSLLAFVVMFVTMLAASGKKQSAEVVFAKYSNESGWSDGMSFIIAVGSCMYAFLGTDSVSHISEEVPRPGYHVPRVMCWTVLIGLGTTIPFFLALLFSVHDLNAVASSGLPIMEVFYQATGNRRDACTVLTVWVLFNFFGVTVSCLATAGRLTWAFARDNGLPYSKIFASVNSNYLTPINATTICVVFCSLYGLIYIGSTAAFSSIISMAILALNISYATPQAILLFRGRDKVLPPRSFRLGRFGPFVNAFSCIWCAFYAVIFCFPVTLPAEVASMNYVSVVLAGIVLFILLFWLISKRKSFTGPDITVEGVETIQEQINQLQQISGKESV